MSYRPKPGKHPGARVHKHSQPDVADQGTRADLLGELATKLTFDADIPGRRAALDDHGDAPGPRCPRRARLLTNIGLVAGSQNGGLATAEALDAFYEPAIAIAAPIKQPDCTRNQFFLSSARAGATSSMHRWRPSG